MKKKLKILRESYTILAKMHRYEEAIKQLKILSSYDEIKLKNIYSYIKDYKYKNHLSANREIVRVEMDNIVFKLTEDDIVSMFFTDYRRIDDIYYVHLSDLFLNLKTGRVHTTDKAIDQKFIIEDLKNKFFKLTMEALVYQYKENKKIFNRIAMMTSINSYLIRNNIKFIFRNFNNKIMMLETNSQFTLIENHYGRLYDLIRIERHKLDEDTNSLLFISEYNNMMDKTYESLDYDQYSQIIDIIGEENFDFSNNIIYSRNGADK